jgi:polysaccharide biosynthesis/export protein
MLKNCIRRVCIVGLALAWAGVGGFSGLAQPAAGVKPPKAGEPVFADFKTGDHADNKQQKAAVAAHPESQVQGEMASVNGATAIAGTTTNAPAGGRASVSGYVADDKYRLRVGDKVSLQIVEDRDAPKSLVVADSGELDVPYVGRMPAAERTCKQLAGELKARLEQEYYHRATVIIALDVANKLLGRIYVWGQVRNQGPIDVAVNENLTVGKAILRAGGFGDFANKKRVKVVRSGGGAKQSYELNLVDILERGKTEKDMLLEPDDFIIVPSRLINF